MASTPGSLSKRLGRRTPHKGASWDEVKRLNFGEEEENVGRQAHVPLVDPDSPIRWIRGPDGRLDHLAMEEARIKREVARANKLKRKQESRPQPPALPRHDDDKRKQGKWLLPLRWKWISLLIWVVLALVLLYSASPRSVDDTPQPVIPKGGEGVDAAALQALQKHQEAAMKALRAELKGVKENEKTLQKDQEAAIKALRAELSGVRQELKAIKDGSAPVSAVNTNKDSIGDLSATVKQNKKQASDDISRVADSIKALEPKVSAHSTSIQELQASLSSLKAAQGDATEIARLEKQIQRALELAPELDSVKSRVSTLEARKVPEPPKLPKILSEAEVKSLITKHAPKPVEQQVVVKGGDGGGQDFIGGVAKPDWALATAGGSIAEPTSKPNYSVGLTEVVSSVFSGTPKRWKGPSLALVPGNVMSPGHCFAFKGNSGVLTVRLAAPTVVKSVSLEYPSPQVANEFTSSPREYQVYGLTQAQLDNQKPGDLLADLRYEIDATSAHHQVVQTQPVDNPENKEYAGVTFKFNSNYGNKYTCIYRVRVHAK